MAMDFQSAMETFAEAWVAATAKGAPLTEPAQSQALALTRPAKSPPLTTTVSAERIPTPVAPRAITPHENAAAAAAAAASNVSPTLKDQQQQFDVSQTSPAKSLPVHCIVEAVCSLDDGRSVLQGAWRRRPFIETDSYVIIPTGTPFQGLVQTALLRLGYSAESAAAAKGSVIIRNWKPLNFDQISEDPLTTVGDILGELTTVATLRIQVFRGKPAALTDIKEKLLRFFLMQSHGLLISSGCPLDEICRSNPGGSQIPEISDEIRRKFEQWWAGQHGLQASRAAGYGYPQYTSPPSSKQSQQPQQPQPERTEVGHPALQTVQNQFPAQKTRMRTSFDPELELPKLQRWFADNQHPTRQQIQQYVKELNNLESRRGRKPLDVNNVVYWFKNARAAQKRAEIRNIGPGLSCHMVNGYGGHGQNGSGFVLAEEQLKEMCRRGRQLSEELSNSGYEMEEEDPGEAQPSSPFGPLSLTTRKDGSRGGSPSPFSPSMPPDIRIDSSKTELKEEPINYHSPNSSNNNNNEEKANLSELEDDEGDSKSRLLEDSSPLSRSNSGRFCPSPETDNQLMSRVQNENLERLAGLPMVPNSMFSHSIMYMSHYIPGFPHAGTSPPGSGGILGISSLTADDRRKRNRTFIDPVSEVPRLEQWFSLNTHPSHNLILKYTEELNCMTYRQKFPKLEPKNVQFWFKNRRAKCKRLKMSLFDGGSYNQSERE